VLLAGGTQGKRLALPNARILIHQPSVGGSGSGQASDIEIQAAEIMRMRGWLEETLSHHSNKSVEQVNKDIDRDKILGASEALEYGSDRPGPDQPQKPADTRQVTLRTARRPWVARRFALCRSCGVSGTGTG